MLGGMMSAMGLGDDDPLFDLKIPWYRVAPEDKGFGRKREGERELMRERQVVLSVRLGDSVRGVHTRLVQRCEVAAERLTLVDAAGNKLGHSEDWDGGTLGQHGVVRPLSKEEKEEQEWEDLDEEDEPAIELEELDDVLDERLREKKTSEEMAQMAIDAVNKKWWDRAADGNLVKVQQFMAEEPRQDLVLINWRNPLNYDRTAVMVASLRGQRKTLEWLVNTHKPRINAYDTNGWADGFEWWTQWTPLNSNPSVPSVRVLGDRGAWPEPDPIHTQNSCTALNLAARGGYPKIVNFLLSKGANAATADNEGWTPAAWALSMGHIEVSQVIANHGNRLGNIGIAAPFSSPHVSPTTLLPLQAIQYKADRVIAAERYTKDVLARRAREQAARQETMRKKKERELLAMQEAEALRRKKELKHSYTRDAREQQSDPAARQPQQRGKFKKKVDLDASPSKDKELESVAEEVAAQEGDGEAAGAAEGEGEPAP